MRVEGEGGDVRCRCCDGWKTGEWGVPYLEITGGYIINIDTTGDNGYILSF